MSNQLCLAHRGWSGKAPENTLSAINLALNHPEVDGVEFDVQLTKDHIPVVIHDYTLERTTNGRGLVRDHTFAELRALDAGSWYHDSFLGEKIPSLEEVLIANQNHKQLNIELKQMNSSPDRVLEEKVLRLVEQYDMEEHVVVTSFQHQMIYHVKRMAPQIKAGPLIYGMPMMLKEQAEHLGADLLSLCYPYLTPELVKHIGEWGYSIIAWTVDEPDHMRMLAHLGPSVQICTNHPDRWLEVKGSTI
ncbi:glycerophosphodiester phosphodiesterase [Brevibacillus daliensis]|uniref:glycerophosphodiester phosphodiesterase n=1 Tax=Brevibacillus daliensis TaxID=2892995 RepID=UPI001E570B0D|nr:glycerophosphodiester phosphodiesterase family protein [Brevibacillus daliensis]